MEWLHTLIGRAPHDLTWWQMGIRGALIFLYLIVLVRLADKRAFGRYTSLDIVLAVILGSTLSRALTGNAPFLPTLFTAAVLVVLHRLMSAAAWPWKTVDHLIKGTESELVRDGEILWHNMRRNQINSHDLMEAVRIQGSTTELADVKLAFIERSGQISVIKQKERKQDAEAQRSPD